MILTSLQSLVEQLKTAMKEMVSTESVGTDPSQSDPMSNLNDL
jgi:hypothetical protein